MPKKKRADPNIYLDRLIVYPLSLVVLKHNEKQLYGIKPISK